MFHPIHSRRRFVDLNLQSSINILMEANRTINYQVGRLESKDWPSSLVSGFVPSNSVQASFCGFEPTERDECPEDNYKLSGED